MNVFFKMDCSDWANLSLTLSVISLKAKIFEVL